MKAKQQEPYSIYQLVNPLFKKAKSAKNAAVKHQYITSALNKEMYYVGNVKAFKECIYHLLCEAFDQGEAGIIIARAFPHISKNQVVVEIYCFQMPSFRISLPNSIENGPESCHSDVFPSFYDHSVLWSPVFPKIFQDNVASFRLDKKKNDFNEAKRLSLWIEGTADLIYISPWLYQYQLRLPLSDIRMGVNI